MQWSAQQQAVFTWVEQGTGSAVLEAVAGSGKTTTLIEAVRRMRGDVFLGAYNAKMGAELKSRVVGIHNAEAGTFHSAGFKALRKAATRRLQVEEKKVRIILDEQLYESPLAEYKSAGRALVSLAKQSGFGAAGLVAAPKRADWYELVQRHDLMEKLDDAANPNRLIDVAARALDASNEDQTTIDFDDMVYLPLLRGLRLFQHDWMLVDEAQDTNASRRLLARKMLKAGGRLLAVGDPHQAIFGFTGADGDSLERIKRDFSAVTLPLSVTYRCPQVVVAAAREYVDHIHAAPSAPEGRHLEIEYDELAPLAEPGDAVLCRLNAPLVKLCFKLIRAGRPAKIEGRSVGEGLAALAGRWKVKRLDALEERLATYFEREVAKAVLKEEEIKQEQLEDQAATMAALIARARELKISSVDGLKEMILGMFEDVGASSKLVVLSSVHRSKGLEWKRVFVLGRRELMPSKRAKQEWTKAQETNLIYVAVTRAMETLVDVSMPAEEAK